MATSIRIQLGLETYQFEIDSGIRVGGGQLLRPAEAARLIQRHISERDLRRLQPLAVRASRRQLEWESDGNIRDVLAQLLASARLRVRKSEAVSTQVLGGKRQEDAAPEPVQNQIVETHQVMIELLDAVGNPVPGEPFRIELPDGRVVEGTLDDQGRAQITGIPQAGTCQVCFYRRDAAIWS